MLNRFKVFSDAALNELKNALDCAKHESLEFDSMVLNGIRDEIEEEIEIRAQKNREQKWM
jgi:hypothetical protein